VFKAKKTETSIAVIILQRCQYDILISRVSVINNVQTVDTGRQTAPPLADDVIYSKRRQRPMTHLTLFSIYVDDLAKSCSSFIGSFIVLYADDILLLAPKVSQLQKLLTSCERVLDQLDMAINSKKSCCLRIGQRQNNPCAPLCTLSGDLISWVDELR